MHKLANIRKPILITGESGTGKTYLAKKLHRESDKKKEAFVMVDLASISESLIESELFGHTKGSFTGALVNKSGYLDKVGGGTLFLDEVGELSLASQKKLLLLFEEKLYSQVGSTEFRSFKGRIIVATNKNLKAMVKEGSFREDLYYRLNIFTLKTTPLRENKKKLKELCEDIFFACKEEVGRQELRLSEETRCFLENYSWHGNIRELKNCLEYVVCMSEGPLVERGELPSWIDEKVEALGEAPHFEQLNYREAVEEFEKKYLNNALLRYMGKINLTSQMLSMNKTTLIAKVRKYGINTHQIKADMQRERSRTYGF